MRKTGVWALLAALLSLFPSVASTCPKWALMPFSAEKVAAALEEVTSTTREGKVLTLKVKAIRRLDYAPDSQYKEISYEIFEEGQSKPVGYGWRHVDPGNFPEVYPALALIDLDARVQKSGIGEAVIRALYNVAPEGGILHISSTNQPTNEALNEIAAEIASIDPKEVEAHLNRYLKRELPLGRGPLWPRVLIRAGWRDLRVLVNRSRGAFSYEFTATKRPVSEGDLN